MPFLGSAGVVSVPSSVVPSSKLEFDWCFIFLHVYVIRNCKHVAVILIDLEPAGHDEPITRFNARDAP